MNPADVTTRRPRWIIECTCTSCGGPLDSVQSTTRAGTEALAIARCSDCAREYTLTVFLRPLTKRPVAA